MIKKGFAGQLAELFIDSKLTIVFVIAALLLGIFATLLTPKEEEPQISVPMIDIQVMSPGLEADEVEKKITEVIEKNVWGLEGVEYVYSTSQPHGALITVRFKVGEPLEPSLVKVHHKVMEIRSLLPEIQTPIVKSYSIDDVPFLTLTFSSPTQEDYTLRTYAAHLAQSLEGTPDVDKIDILGGLRRTIRVSLSSKKMESFGVTGVTLMDVARALSSNNIYLPAGKNWGASEIYDIDVGGKPITAREVGAISVGQKGGRIIRIEDVADVEDGPEERVRASVLLKKDQEKILPAVTLSFTKRKGTNVVTLSENILSRVNQLRQKGSDIQMDVTRNYGETAKTKSDELIEHLLIATVSVALLIALFMGLRSSLVVAIAIPVTLSLTLAIYYFLGYTLNRVTLFALIFSIGILVDDAIVVVENIERHFHLSYERGAIRSIIDAVSEIGNPTILATVTVIAAILPMAFVRGLMGPYMKPIPVGASLAMIVSLFVAFIVTPWASLKILKKPESTHNHNSRLDQLYEKIMGFLIHDQKKSVLFGMAIFVLLLTSASLIYFKAVRVKMLPFDNKNEFQVLIDYPSHTPLSESRRLTDELAKKILNQNGVDKVQVYVGQAAPFSFSGMVKHVFLRGRDDQADLQVLLVDKNERSLSSHQLIELLRPIINQFGKENHAVTKVLEIPPGPPVLSTVLAEIYGPDVPSREAAAREVASIMSREASVVDLDTTLRPGRERLRYSLDFIKAGELGVHSQALAWLGSLMFSETPVGLIHDPSHPEEIPIRLSLEESIRSSQNPFSQQILPSMESGVVRVADVMKAPEKLKTEYRYRKNLKPVSYVMSELSGTEEAPIYGMLKIAPQIQYPQQTAQVPWDTSSVVIKWDGEWFITYEVFRDLGAAFAVVMVLIYILVLGWFKSFKVPLIIMAPIPISLIGILPGHALTGVYFTATSMIGFIAGAGIIVRNSIILVDFIEHLLKSEPSLSLKEVVIKAGIIRFRPMLLTASAVVVGSSVMLFDPIFQGLAVSLIFGEVAATLISRFAVPVLYYWFGQPVKEPRGFV